eukprot:scaffold17515_cov146-Skeletonema_marinoi.AAC.1
MADLIQRSSAIKIPSRILQTFNRWGVGKAYYQADIKLPIEIRESLKHAIKCDQKSMQVEGRVDAFCLPVCLICDRVIFGCETVHKVDKEAVLATKSKFSIEEHNSFYDMELHAE